MTPETEKEFIKRTSIPGVLLIERPMFPDNRGFFHEVVRVSDLKEHGVIFNPIQWSHSVSLPKVIRAIHTENWQKVIYPLSGIMFAAICDVRSDSETFGKVEEFVFDNETNGPSGRALYLPPGIGNSVCVMGDKPVHYMYIVDEYWDNSKAKGIAWNDPDLAVNWPITDPVISERDQKNPTLRELYPEKFNK